MFSLLTPAEAEMSIAESVRARRIELGLTQSGLAARSGVSLGSVRRFEQNGAISLESLLKLLVVVGGIDELTALLKPTSSQFETLDDVFKIKPLRKRKRGRKT